MAPRAVTRRSVLPAGWKAAERGGDPPRPETVRVPAGAATLGADPAETPFAWDNELPARRVDVAAFEIDAYDVTNLDFLEFVEAGGYAPGGTLVRRRAGAGGASARIESPLFWEREAGRWLWRGMFERLPLPPAWPVYVSQAEASAYARWKGRASRRRPSITARRSRRRRGGSGSTRGATSRPIAIARTISDSKVRARPGRFAVRPARAHGGCTTSSATAGSGPRPCSAPFPGFRRMASYPQYSADFFDGKHFVLKGASPATGRELVRRSLRNWFRPDYPYVYASFHLVRDPRR